MKFKINDIVTTEFGVGKIVYVNNSEIPYLVHIDGFDGHDGSIHEPAIQDNYNNWWFSDECLELVKRNDNKYEVGDLVRVFGKGKVRRIVEIIQVFGYRLEGDINFYISEELEPVTHLTTKDFIKEVEKLGLRVREYENDFYIYVDKDNATIYIDTRYTNRFNSNLAYLNDEELDLVVKYVKTPIEFREEPKKYTLQCPETDFYYGYANQNKKELTWRKPGKYKKMFKDGIKVRENVYMLHFTQQEIDNLPNQEFIKTLIRKEVEND